MCFCIFSMLQFGFFCYNVQAFTSQIISHVSKVIAGITRGTRLASSFILTGLFTARALLLPRHSTVGREQPQRDASTCRALLPESPRLGGHEARRAVDLQPHAGEDWPQAGKKPGRLARALPTGSPIFMSSVIVLTTPRRATMEKLQIKHAKEVDLFPGSP